MIRAVISDGKIEFHLNNKGVYNYLADLYENWSMVVELCNAKGSPHTRGNGYKRQLQLLGILRCFTSWNANHDTAGADENRTTTERCQGIPPSSLHSC